MEGVTDDAAEGVGGHEEDGATECGEDEEAAVVGTEDEAEDVRDDEGGCVGAPGLYFFLVHFLFTTPGH